MSADTIEQLAQRYAVAKAQEDQLRSQVNTDRRRLSIVSRERHHIGRLLYDARMAVAQRQVGTEGAR